MFTEGGDKPQLSLLERFRLEGERYGQDPLAYGIERLDVRDPDVPILLREYYASKNPDGDPNKQGTVLLSIRAEIFGRTTGRANRVYQGWFEALTVLGQELSALPPQARPTTIVAK
jgi:hypothetical protein